MEEFSVIEPIRLKVMDFTENPGPRYIRQDKDGDSNSGEAFYIQKLNHAFAEALRNKCHLIIELDGVSGYPSSFLDEAIGELVYDFGLDKVSTYLSYDTFMFKRRIKQVKEETYPQWEERRKRGDIITHSSEINSDIYYINAEGNLELKHIE